MTMQVKDVVKYNGENFSLLSGGLIDFTNEFGLEYEICSTAGHGCDPVYEIRDGRLYLEELDVYLGAWADYPEINGVKPCKPSERADAQNVAAFSSFGSSSEGHYEKINYPVKYTGELIIGRDYDWKNNPDPCSGPWGYLYLKRVKFILKDGYIASQEDIPPTALEERKAHNAPFAKITPEQWDANMNNLGADETEEERFNSSMEFLRKQEQEASNIPEEVPRSTMYSINDKNYTLVGSLGFVGRGLQCHAGSPISDERLVPFSVYKRIGNVSFPVYHYKWDKAGDPRVDALWLCVKKHMNVDKMQVDRKGPNKIVGDSPRFAFFELPWHPVKSDATGLYLFGRELDDYGQYRIRPWDYKELIIAKVFRGGIWETENVSHVAEEIRNWAKTEEGRETVEEFNDFHDRYETRVASRFPDIAKKYIWWFPCYTREANGCTEEHLLSEDALGNDAFADKVRNMAKGNRGIFTDPLRDCQESLERWAKESSGRLTRFYRCKHAF